MVCTKGLMLDSILIILAIALVFIVPYCIFYLREISLKILLPMLTIGIMIMMYVLPDEYDFVGGIVLYLWCYLVIIGIWKLFSYRVGFARVIRRCMIDLSDKDIYKLGRYIKNRRINYKWAKKECLKQSQS